MTEFEKYMSDLSDKIVEANNSTFNAESAASKIDSINLEFFLDESLRNTNKISRIKQSIYNTKSKILKEKDNYKYTINELKTKYKILDDFYSVKLKTIFELFAQGKYKEALEFNAKADNDVTRISDNKIKSKCNSIVLFNKYKIRHTMLVKGLLSERERYDLLTDFRYEYILLPKEQSVNYVRDIVMYCLKDAFDKENSYSKQDYCFALIRVLNDSCELYTNFHDLLYEGINFALMTANKLFKEVANDIFKNSTSIKDWYKVYYIAHSEYYKFECSIDAFNGSKEFCTNCFYKKNADKMSNTEIIDSVRNIICDVFGDMGLILSRDSFYVIYSEAHQKAICKNSRSFVALFTNFSENQELGKEIFTYLKKHIDFNIFFYICFELSGISGSDLYSDFIRKNWKRHKYSPYLIFNAYSSISRHRKSEVKKIVNSIAIKLMNNPKVSRAIHLYNCYNCIHITPLPLKLDENDNCYHSEKDPSIFARYVLFPRFTKKVFNISCIILEAALFLGGLYASYLCAKTGNFFVGKTFVYGATAGLSLSLSLALIRWHYLLYIPKGFKKVTRINNVIFLTSYISTVTVICLLTVSFITKLSILGNISFVLLILDLFLYIETWVFLKENSDKSVFKSENFAVSLTFLNIATIIYFIIYLLINK